MALLLPSVLSVDDRAHNPLLLIQSSAAQSSLPILRYVLDQHIRRGELIILCTLYAPDQLLKGGKTDANVHILDWRTWIPGYEVEETRWEERIEKIYRVLESTNSSAKPLTFVIDSVDTLEDNLGSSSKTCKFISQIFTVLQKHTSIPRLVCHLTSHSSLLSFLKQTSFSPSLVHLTAYPPIVFTHIASEYLTLPPTTDARDDAPSGQRFWKIFVPLADRPHEVESLVFDNGGEGGAGGGPRDEFVVDVLVRSRGTDAVNSVARLFPGKRRGVQRALEGWCPAEGGAVKIDDLPSLKGIWARKRPINIELEPVDPTKNLTFNLSLTESQQVSRSQVPLPYEHGGAPEAARIPQIFYDPDSADDLDDEDPDEDLEI